MIIPKQDLMEITGLPDSFNLDLTHKGVEQEIKNYCGWNLESATYTNIMVDGTGGRWIWPGHKNITDLIRAGVDQVPAINIKNGTAASNAYAKVTYTDLTPTALGLVVADGAALSSTTEAFSTYSTMTLLVAQINARSGSGWSAELYNSDYGIMASTNLIEVDNKAAGTWDGNDPGWTALDMPGKPVSDVAVERVEGGLFRPSGWPPGVQNIPLTYTAGWTTPNMPADLQQAVVMLTQFFWNKHQQQTTGIKSFSLRNLRIEYALGEVAGVASSIPIEVLNVLDTTYKIKGL